MLPPKFPLHDEKGRMESVVELEIQVFGDDDIHDAVRRVKTQEGGSVRGGGPPHPIGGLAADFHL